MFLPKRSLNLLSRQNFREFAKSIVRLNKTPSILVIGGRVKGEGIETLLAHTKFFILETDIQTGPRTQLICDGHLLPFQDGQFDAIVIQAVLEHVLDPVQVVSELHRVLKRGGIVYAETPFMQQVHGAPYDFQRYTYLGHRRLFRWFEEMDAGPLAGPGTALSWAWEHFLTSFSERPRIRGVLLRLARYSGFWMKHCDRLLLKKAGAWDGASAYYFVGRKADQPLSDRELLTQFRCW